MKILDIFCRMKLYKSSSNLCLVAAASAKHQATPNSKIQTAVYISLCVCFQEAKAIIAQRSGNPREFFKQKERAMTISVDTSPVSIHRSGKHFKSQLLSCMLSLLSCQIETYLNMKVVVVVQNDIQGFLKTREQG